MNLEVDRPGRAKTHIMVHVRAELDGKEIGFYGWADNFSGEGMRLSCEQLLEVGAGIELDFIVPLTKERITVKGEAVRREPEPGPDGHVYGVRFGGFSEGNDQKLRDYVAWQLGL